MTFTSPPPYAVRMAVAAAKHSPCAKSKRGVAVYCGTNGEFLVAVHNSPPHPLTCASQLPSVLAHKPEIIEACKAACSKIAVHAEQAAVLAARDRFPSKFNLPSEHRPGLVHVKVDAAGELVAGGGPSCWQCSKFLMHANVSGIWLYEARRDGDPHVWKFYTPLEFHLDTVAACDLPTAMRAEVCVETIRQLTGDE